MDGVGARDDFRHSLNRSKIGLNERNKIWIWEEICFRCAFCRWRSKVQCQSSGKMPNSSPCTVYRYILLQKQRMWSIYSCWEHVQRRRVALSIHHLPEKKTALIYQNHHFIDVDAFFCCCYGQNRKLVVEQLKDFSFSYSILEMNSDNPSVREIAFLLTPIFRRPFSIMCYVHMGRNVCMMAFVSFCPHFLHYFLACPIIHQIVLFYRVREVWFCTRSMARTH